MKWKNCLASKKVFESRGREREWEKKEKMIGHFSKERPFLLDSFSLSNSKAMRRIRNCAQVFPGIVVNPYIRTRGAHIMEVAVLSEAIAVELGLNADLARAIALGHDIGHVSFCHVGEDFLAKQTEGLFSHAVFSAIIAREIEREGKGLNLTYETLDGIINHSGGRFVKKTPNEPEENVVVRIADKISYIFSDLSDARRFGYLKEKKLPKIIKIFGPNQRSAVNCCLEAIYRESAEKGEVSFIESPVALAFEEIKKWMFSEVYSQINDLFPNDLVLETIFNYLKEIFSNHDPVLSFALLSENEMSILIKDLGAVKNYNRQEFIEHYQDFGILEILKYVEGKKLNFSNYNLPKSKFRILE